MNDILHPAQLALADVKANAFLQAKATTYDVGAELKAQQDHRQYEKDQSVFNEQQRKRNGISEIFVGVAHDIKYREPPATLLTDAERGTIDNVKSLYARTGLNNPEAKAPFIQAMQDLNKLQEPQKTHVLGELLYEAANEAVKINNPKRFALAAAVIADNPAAEHMSFKMGGETLSYEQMVKKLAQEGGRDPQAYVDALGHEVTRAKDTKAGRGQHAENSLPAPHFTPAGPNVPNDIRRS